MTLSADALRRARERAGHSVVAVALVCEVDSAEVDSWESVRPDDALAHAPTLADLYGVEDLIEACGSGVDDGRSADGQQQASAGAPRPSTRPRAVPAKAAGSRKAAKAATRTGRPDRRPPTQPPGAGTSPPPADPDGIPRVVRVAIAVAWLEPEPLRVAASIAGLGEPGAGDADILAKTAVALASLGDDAQAALRILAALADADEIAIGIALGRAGDAEVEEIAAILNVAGASARSEGSRYLAAEALASLDGAQRGALAQVAAMVTAEEPRIPAPS